MEIGGKKYRVQLIFIPESKCIVCQAEKPFMEAACIYITVYGIDFVGLNKTKKERKKNLNRNLSRIVRANKRVSLVCTAHAWNLPNVMTPSMKHIVLCLRLIYARTSELVFKKKNNICSWSRQSTLPLGKA